MGKILLAREKPQEGTALLGNVVTDQAAQHRILYLERVQHGALGGLARDIKFNLAARMRQRAQMSRENEPDHGSV